MSETPGDYMVEVAERDPSLRERVVAERTERDEKRLRIMRLRRQGMSPDEISAALARSNPPISMTPEGVRSAISTYLRRVRNETDLHIEEERQLENEKLDALEVKLNAALYIDTGEVEVVNGQERKVLRLNTRVAGQLIKLSERRSKLNGLDAPTRIEHTGDIQHHIVDPTQVREAEDAFKAAFGHVVDTTAIDITDGVTGELPPPADEAIEHDLREAALAEQV